jgi:superkiller protein 3
LFVANVFIQRNNLPEALNIVEKSIQQNVTSKELLLKRAWLIYQLSGVQLALPELVSLNTAYPDQPAILRLLAQAEMESGDLTQAEQIAAQALSLDPDQPNLNLLMGKLQRLAGQLDQSIHYLSESIRQEPNKADAYLELGRVYLDRRETAQALQVYQKAMKSVPKDYRPFYHSGLIMREGKDYRNAEIMLRRAAELAPDDLNIRRQLGAVITLNLIHSSQEASSSNESQHASLY